MLPYLFLYAFLNTSPTKSMIKPCTFENEPTMAKDHLGHLKFWLCTWHPY